MGRLVSGAYVRVDAPERTRVLIKLQTDFFVEIISNAFEGKVSYVRAVIWLHNNRMR